MPEKTWERILTTCECCVKERNFIAVLPAAWSSSQENASSPADRRKRWRCPAWRRRIRHHRLRPVAGTAGNAGTAAARHAAFLPPAWSMHGTIGAVMPHRISVHFHASDHASDSTKLKPHVPSKSKPGGVVCTRPGCRKPCRSAGCRSRHCIDCDTGSGGGRNCGTRLAAAGRGSQENEVCLEQSPKRSYCCGTDGDLRRPHDPEFDSHDGTPV